MKKKSYVLWVAVFFLTVPSLVWSAQPRNRARPANYAQEKFSESPWYLFVGSDLGSAHYSTYKDSVTEAPRGGTDLGLRLLLAHYTYDWVIDGGLGWQVINNKGTNSDGSQNSDNTRNAYVDFSARYRLDRHWQIGPEFEYWVGTDKGLNPTVVGSDTIADGDNTSAWLGLQAMYEWTKAYKYRLGARALTDLNVADRTVVVLQVFFQVGFDVFGAGEPVQNKNYERMNDDDLDRVESRNSVDPLYMSPEATPWPSTTPEPEPEVLTTPAPPPVEATPEPKPTPEPVTAKAPPKVILTLDVNDLPFGFNNSNLPKSNAARVKKIGEFLKSNNKAWKQLIVGGHTDERGSKEFNQKLSQRRAETVRALLVEGGANAKKVRAVGYGETQPRDHRHNESAWAKNRRVELEFKGVKDMVLIKKAMNQ
jgi:peptidoglycan-associated lipoprotein